MSMLNCDRCGNSCHISHKWTYCPKCGGPMKHESESSSNRQQQAEYREYLRLKGKFDKGRTW